MKLQKENHYEWQKENFKAYAFAQSAKKILELTPKLTMPNDKRKTLKLILSREAPKKKIWINSSTLYLKFFISIVKFELLLVSMATLPRINYDYEKEYK